MQVIVIREAYQKHVIMLMQYMRSQFYVKLVDQMLLFDWFIYKIDQM